MTTPKNDDEALCLTVAEVGKELYENRIRLSNGHPAASIEMAIRALQSAYERALNHYRTIDNIGLDAVLDKWVSRPPLPSGAVQSTDMQRCERLLEGDPNGGTFSGWLSWGRTEFEHQIFDRTELQRWVEANGVVSSYRFDGVKADTNVPASAAVRATALMVTLAPVVANGAFSGVETAEAGPLAVEQGLSTKDIAACFGGCYYSADNWPKRLSGTAWLDPACIARGEAGGASAIWNPLTLAHLMHGKKKDDEAKEKLMKTLNSRFTRNPALMPWRVAFNEYYATHCTTD